MPRVEAAEEQLDEPARDLRREHALGGRVEAADVQRARVPQRRGRCARRERLVHVHDVERRAIEQACRSSRATSIGSETCPPRRAGVGERLHRREHPHLARLRTASPGRAAAARISRRESRTSARDPLGASTSTQCPRAASPSRERLDVLVDLARAPPTGRASPGRSRAGPRRAAGIHGLRISPQPVSRRVTATARASASTGLSRLAPSWPARRPACRACSAMNSSVRSRATGSGTCFGGDFIR